MKCRVYITKSRAGHYYVTAKALTPWGVWSTANYYCHGLIGTLSEARRLAAETKAALEEEEQP